MRGKSSLFGYSRASVEQYVSLLVTEEQILQEQLEIKRRQFAEELQPVSRSLERIKQELQQLDRLDTRLSEWISLHEKK